MYINYNLHSPKKEQVVLQYSKVTPNRAGVLYQFTPESIDSLAGKEFLVEYGNDRVQEAVNSTHNPDEKLKVFSQVDLHNVCAKIKITRVEETPTDTIFYGHIAQYGDRAYHLKQDAKKEPSYAGFGIRSLCNIQGQAGLYNHNSITKIIEKVVGIDFVANLL